MERQLHPCNLLPLWKRRRMAEWDQLGLEPMEESGQLSDPDSAVDPGAESSEESDRERFSTNVSDWAQEILPFHCRLSLGSVL